MLRLSLFLVVVVAACSSSSGSKTKGGGATGASAMSSGQKAGGNAVADHSKGTDDGAAYDGITCDASTEGLAWCDSDTNLAVCAGGEWWVLDCSSAEIGGDFCGDDGQTIDCYANDEF